MHAPIYRIKCAIDPNHGPREMCVYTLKTSTADFTGIAMNVCTKQSISVPWRAHLCIGGEISLRHAGNKQKREATRKSRNKTRAGVIDLGETVK